MAEGVFKEDLQRYFADARSWDADRLRAAKRSQRLAWILAAIGLLVGMAGIFAVAALTPLKRVELVTVRVNNNTGAVDVETQLTGKRPVRYDEAVTKYFLSQYVRTRESWNPADASESFDTVSILSTPSEQQRWAAAASPRNPNSARVQWGDRAFVLARVTNISFINNRVANVRYTRTIQTDTGAQSTDWIATVTFGYTNAPLAEGDRYRNPLGFQVELYRTDPVVTP